MNGIGLDWGTTNLRAFLFNDSEILSSRHFPHGIRSLPLGGFKAAFDESINGFPIDAPVYLYGMVGAAEGWAEMSYVDCPCNALQFSKTVLDVSTLVGRKAFMCPGLKYQDGNIIEMVRGEEIQVWGVVALYPDAKNIILPGTHSKWVQVNAGFIQQLRTTMTGEFYSLLRQHSILNSTITQQFSDSQWQAGVILAKENELDLMSLAFQCRSHLLSGYIEPQHVESFLSGLLIGLELRQLPSGPTIYIVGEEQLTTRYQNAFLLIDPDRSTQIIPSKDAGHMGLLSIQAKL
jgi:2-dehydro-3-deoxygalactonokinase